MVFDSPKGGYIPPILHSQLVLRVSLRNRNAIDFALDQILSAPVPRKKHSIFSVLPNKILPYQLSNLASEAEKAIEESDGQRFEEVISIGIQSSGVEMAIRPTLENREMDLAVWADEFQSLVGNPFLIET